MTWKFRTRLIHGAPEDPLTGAVVTPIYQTSTFRQVGVGLHKGYEYARTSNPTRAALEAVAADLEGGARGIAFASGMAAITAVFSLFSQGDHVVCGDDVYGGTYRVLSRVFQRFGIEVDFVDTSGVANVEAAMRANTRAVYVETPSNPLMKITDLAAVAELCRARGALLIVDNTFMTPYWQRPLELGADIVVHSATKYLGGHSDLVAGLVVARDAELGERLAFLQNSMGGVLAPHDAYLLLRGIKTLALRMEAHEANARRVAEWLRAQPAVRAVHYPGLPEHPGHDVHRRQARGFGGMLSFELASAEAAEIVATRTQLFVLAESLGAVESLISVPARMTHASIPPERRMELGITDGLVRLSVGVEDVDDLIDDLATAFAGLPV
ncbi:MAG: bifunctional cystathionine gamma-lyase/homocysteine desulfhydrase [Clostridia bacterium]|nr:bifunctional cystathionine gamma-lyase/homocysteine desulfhydrase [Clostridia bacterium]